MLLMTVGQPASFQSETWTPDTHYKWSKSFGKRPHRRKGVPQKTASSLGRSEPPTNTWFLGPTEVHIPNGISIGSDVFAGLMAVSNRQTDRPRYTCSNRSHLCTVCMRYSLTMSLFLHKCFFHCFNAVPSVL